MAFLETPRFPVDINYGSTGGPVFSTDVVRYGNGKEYRNSNWQYQLNRYDIRYAVKTRAQAINVYEFFLARKGRFEGFRIKDEFDFTSNSDGVSAPSSLDQSLGFGNGAQTQFQLTKVYTKGAEQLVRTIKKPVVGSVLVNVGGVDKTEGPDYTVDYTTGLITFTSAPGVEAIKVGFEFDIPVRFDTDDLSELEYIIKTNSNSTRLSFPSIPLMEVLDS